MRLVSPERDEDMNRAELTLVAAWQGKTEPEVAGGGMGGFRHHSQDTSFTVTLD